MIWKIHLALILLVVQPLFTNAEDKGVIQYYLRGESKNDKESDRLLVTGKVFSFFKTEICHKTSETEYSTQRVPFFKAILYKIFRGDKRGLCGNQCSTLCKDYTCFVVSDDDSKCTCSNSCVPDVILSIDSPEPNFISRDREIVISGSITPIVTGVIKVLNYESTILSSGHFDIENFLLAEGLNEISIAAISGDGQTIASKSVNGTYQPQSEVSSSITPEAGGRAEVIDGNSVLLGAMVDIPAGAATRSFSVNVVYDPELVSNLPFGLVAVGPPITLTPVAEEFLTKVKVTIPFNHYYLPNGTSTTDVFMIGLSDDGWVSVPDDLVVVAQDRLTADILAFDRRVFVAVVEIPLKSGQVLIDTVPAYATIYIDGAELPDRSPLVVDNVVVGNHTMKLYIPGFNEVFYKFQSTNKGARIALELGVPSTPVPLVQVDPELNGTMVDQGYIEVKGRVSWNGTVLSVGYVVISVNNKDSIQNLMSDGTFSGFVTLSTGQNVLEVRANGPNGSTGVSSKVIITRNTQTSNTTNSRVLSSHLPNLDRKLTVNTEVVVKLTWNTINTDIDLHVFDPNGRHAWYGLKSGIPGGALDVDDTNGFGPEIFSLQSPIPGRYRVTVDSFSISNIPTVATIGILIGGEEIFSGTYTFTKSDNNYSHGSPVGANPAAFWDTHTFEIGALSIIKVETVTPSPLLSNAIFTTLTGENTIDITVDAPSTVADSSILYEIKEISEVFTVDTSSISGRKVSVKVQHKQLSSLTAPKSHPLEYKIIAYTVKNGVRDLESSPVFIKQDLRSQIRQEYVDKRDFSPAFSLPIPDRKDIIDASQFYKGTGNFDFEELAGYSDYGPGLAVIRDSINIANKLRDAWGQPLTVTSGWRNPRRNDRLEFSVIDSLHQSGDAVDLQPSTSKNKWPKSIPGCLSPPGKEIKNFSEAQDALRCLATKIFDQNMYDVLFHNNHLHIERDPKGEDPDPEGGESGETKLLQLQRGELILIGEGLVSQIYWPGGSSGVTLGIGYDIGSRSAESVINDLISAGMERIQAVIIAEGAGLQGTPAQVWVTNNKNRVGHIDHLVSTNLFSSLSATTKQEAFRRATSTQPDELNARSREIKDNVPPGTYVMTAVQWNGLHPAMVEFIVDLTYNGGYYGYDQIAQINKGLIEQNNNQLAQFKAVAKLFGNPPPPAGELSFMDDYAKRLGVTGGNIETFYKIPAADIKGATTRRNRIRLSFLVATIKALEQGDAVVMVP